MTTDLNDMQRQVLTRLKDAADAYRATLRPIAEDFIDSVLDGQAAGLSRDEMVDTFTRALANHKLSAK